MILLFLQSSTAAPPGTPWWAVIGGPLVALLISGGFSVLVARTQRAASPDLKAFEDRVGVLETQMKAIAGTDSAAIEKVREDLGALAADIETLRAEVQRRWKADDSRRERAGALAATDRKELHEALAALRERVAGMAGRLEGLMERSHGH